jgi:uncharacterized membrane protein YadS
MMVLFGIKMVKDYLIMAYYDYLLKLYIVVNGFELKKIQIMSINLKIIIINIIIIIFTIIKD